MHGKQETRIPKPDVPDVPEGDDVIWVILAIVLLGSFLMFVV